MHKPYIVGTIVLLLLFQGCKSIEKQSKETKKYTRRPIVEVSEEQLKIDAMLIDAKTKDELGYPQEAMNIYRNIIKQKPDYSVAYYEMGTILFANGMVDSAIYYNDKALKLSPKNMWYMLQQATYNRSAGDFKKAIKIMEKVIKQQPEVMEYYYELANMHITNNQIDKAIGVFDRVEKRVGKSETISLQKQRLWKVLGNEDKALQEIEELAKAFPADNKYNAILAEMYMGKKDYKKAFEYYNKILKNNPSDEYIHISRANYYKLIGNAEKAYQELKLGFENNDLSAKENLSILTTFYNAEEFYGEKSKYTFDLVNVIMKNDPDTMSQSLFYGDVLMRQKKYKEAAHQLNTYIKMDSSDYNIWEALLICESEIPNNDDRLAQLCGRAINLFPFQPMPYFMKGVIHYSRYDYKEAIKLLEEGLKWSSGNAVFQSEFLMLLTECYYRIGEYDKCFAHFDEFFKLKPNDMGMLNNYAYYMSELDKRLEDAEKMSKRTIEAQPKNSTFLDTYGWIMYKMGRYEEAEKYIKQAIDNDKEPSATLYEHYGDIMQKLNNPDEAKTYWKKALEHKDADTKRLNDKINNGLQ